MPVKFIVLGIVFVMYAAVIIFPHKKAVWTLVAGLLVVLIGVVSPVMALTELISWSVLMIYVGSLAIADLFIYSRVPARIADEIVNHSPNPGIAIVIIIIITSFISAFVENVATVLLMAPIALSLSKKVNIKPTYFMLGLAVMANLQGTATLVGDPPSMIFASFASKALEVPVGFNEFFFYLGKPSIFFIIQAGMLVGAIYFYVIFSKTAKKKITVVPEKILSIVPTILLILMVAALAACSFILKQGVTLEAGLSTMILAIIGLIWYQFVRKIDDKKTFSVVKGLDWETILFLIGIFVVIGALAETGALEDLATLLSAMVGGNVLLGFVVIIVVSIIISGFVDNVPYIIAMLPVTVSMAAKMNIQSELYMFALLVGSCLGGNLTPFGASANIVAVGILKKEGIDLNFGGWLKTGLPFTFLTTTAAALLLWFIWR
ncbi:MAG: SLC13 family permease [Termitinemataceae bacterium]|nr:MAG: SLC13 family permease [Termitinemataceae bacterium]